MFFYGICVLLSSELWFFFCRCRSLTSTMLSLVDRLTSLNRHFVSPNQLKSVCAESFLSSRLEILLSVVAMFKPLPFAISSRFSAVKSD